MSTTDLLRSESFALSKRPLRNSAKAIIIRNNQVLCTKNFDFYGDFYLLPGGGQNHGETLPEALKRECLEETGANIEVGQLLFVREYISANHELKELDASIHQIEFMFFCKLLSDPVVSAACCVDAMQTGIEWLQVEELLKKRFYPGSLVEHLKDISHNKGHNVYLGDTL